MENSFKRMDIQGDLWLVECSAKDAETQFRFGRRESRFWLKPLFNNVIASQSALVDLAHHQMILADVQRQVFESDGGRYQRCSSAENLPFDHMFPYSKVSSSKITRNIRFFRAKHSFSKSDKFVWELLPMGQYILGYSVSSWSPKLQLIFPTSTSVK